MVPKLPELLVLIAGWLAISLPLIFLRLHYWPERGYVSSLAAGFLGAAWGFLVAKHQSRAPRSKSTPPDGVGTVDWNEKLDVGGPK